MVTSVECNGVVGVSEGWWMFVCHSSPTLPDLPNEAAATHARMHSQCKAVTLTRRPHNRGRLKVGEQKI